MKYFVNRDLVTKKINGSFAVQQSPNQEQIDETHIDYQEFLLIPKISQIRSMRNRKLDEIDTKYCNAQRWSAMTQAEKDSWAAIKTALIGLTNKDADGNYLYISVNNADSYLNGAQNVWPW